MSVETAGAQELLASRHVREVEVLSGTGIYFLLSGVTVVYVGQTTNLATVQSRHADKEYDRFLFRPVPERDLDYFEQACIVHFRPRYNRSIYFKKIAAMSAALIVSRLLS